MDTLYMYIDFCCKLALDTWANIFNSLGVHDLDHTHSLQAYNGQGTQQQTKASPDWKLSTVPKM